MTVAWVLVGLFLWGLPTGIGLAFMLANLSFQGGLKVAEFEVTTFTGLCGKLLPLFLIAGVFLGIYMGRMCERARKG